MKCEFYVEALMKAYGDLTIYGEPPYHKEVINISLFLDKESGLAKPLCNISKEII